MKHIVLASVSVLAIVAGPAYAQSSSDAQSAPVPQASPRDNAPQGGAPNSVSDSQAGLQDIIVTAQRTSESAQRAPIAIAVLRPEELIRQNVTRAEDLSRVVPALLVTASGGPNTSFFVRGVGNFSSNSYSDPAISFNYDGVPIGRPSATQGFFYDLQRVEVLKGPQGTLYGRNATGGAINVIPNRPVIGETSADIQASYGNYDAVQARAALNFPIGENGALRLAGAYNKHDGYLSDGTSDQDEIALRGQVLAELTPNLTTRIGADYAREAGIGTGSFIYGTFAYTGPTTGYVFTPTPQLGPKIGVHDPRSEAFLQTRFVAQAGRTAEATGSYPDQDNSVWGFTSETNWKTAAGALTVIGAYRELAVHSLSTTSNFRGFRQDEEADQFTLEARFSGTAGPVDYLLGAFLFDENINPAAINNSAINQFTLIPFQTYKTGTNSKAGFGRLAAHLTDTITLTAAGRYTHDLKHFGGVSDVFALFCGSPAPPQDFCPTVPLMPLVYTRDQVIAFYTARGVAFGPPGSRGPNTPTVFETIIPINNASLKTNKFTYRLAADWQATPSNLLYASYETGFHGGGFNFARGLETYRPETIQAWTVGSKNRFFDNRAQLNIEAFYWKYKDQQVAQFGFDLGVPPASVFYTSNIGNSSIKGVDVDFEVKVTPTTRLSGTAQYLNAKYDNFVTFAGNNGLPPNFNCPITAPSPTQFRIDCSGRQSLFSPKWSFTANIEQTIALDGFKLVADAGTRWRDDFYAATSYQPWVISKAAFQSDASLTLAPESDKWFITGFINNIENKRRITQANINATFNTMTAISTAPRTYGVRIGARFK